MQETDWTINCFSVKKYEYLRLAIHIWSAGTPISGPWSFSVPPVNISKTWCSGGKTRDQRREIGK